MNIYLDEEQAAHLDVLAAAEGISRHAERALDSGQIRVARC
ncbi:ribbon-helix-helix protein, CopG family [[Mycobacterium] kokjensenii]